jgi:hypothetical protein
MEEGPTSGTLADTAAGGPRRSEEIRRELEHHGSGEMW